ncbi:tripartite motif-containing protein 44 [Aulostomus maculatus]
MDQQGNPLEGGMELKNEDLPQMDGSCDACEPDEAQPATQVCHTCSFAFCPVHADRHASSTHHPLIPYKHEGAQANGLVLDRDSIVTGTAKDESVTEGAAGENRQQMSDAHERDDVEKGDESKKGVGEGTEGAEAAGEAGRKDTVTVERLRCKEHEQEGSLYCKPDEKIICVVCAVQGEHREHEIITLHEAYVWQKNRQGYDLLGCTRQMGENIQAKWNDPKMSTDELEDYVDSQFDELRKLVRLEERRTLHLVDLKEAFLTASAAEKIAEITLETERLQEEMANITHQLCMLEKAEGQEIGPVAAAQAVAVPPGPIHRRLHGIEARPRLPEPRADPVDPRDLGDGDSGPSMDHAP